MELSKSICQLPLLVLPRLRRARRTRDQATRDQQSVPTRDYALTQSSAFLAFITVFRNNLMSRNSAGSTGIQATSSIVVFLCRKQSLAPVSATIPSVSTPQYTDPQFTSLRVFEYETKIWILKIPFSYPFLFL